MFGIDLVLALVLALVWLIIICLPWQPWRTREVLEVPKSVLSADLSQITVVIPARNEADVIDKTLSALAKQGSGLNIIVVDDESSDATTEIAYQSGIDRLQVIRSTPLPEGWTGKLWAQEQGLKKVNTTYTLLLDADIELAPNTIKSVLNKLKQERLQFVSLMAKLHFLTNWEKLLMPAFVYFFKMIYPFHLSNKPGNQIAGAAGGFILVETQVLHQVGGMAAIKDAIIDDCSLAKKIKGAGYMIWTGLTHAVISQRSYLNLNEIWQMVARTAFTQLNYSVGLLLTCTMILLLIYWLPLVGMFFWQGWAFWLSLFSFNAMCFAYFPTLKFYTLSLGWAILMPVTAGFYLFMTWSSALRYWRGERSRWKGRIYQKA